MPADLLCPFAHPLQAPVIRAAAFFKDFRINAPAIVTDPQAKLSRIVSDFHFNLAAIGVSESVDDRLSPNPITLFPDHGIHPAPPAFDNRLKGCVGALRGLLRNSLEGRRQTTELDRGGAQISQAVSSFSQNLVGVIERFLQRVMSRLISRNLFCDGVELQDQSLHALQKSIVQVSRDPLALFESLFHPSPALPGALFQPE